MEGRGGQRCFEKCQKKTAGLVKRYIPNQTYNMSKIKNLFKFCPPFSKPKRDFIEIKINFAPGEWCEESGTRRGKNDVAQRWGCCTRPWFLCSSQPLVIYLFLSNCDQQNCVNHCPLHRRPKFSPMPGPLTAAMIGLGNSMNTLNIFSLFCL